ncbi:aminoglycoside phosphotransferase family protein [Actinokineospora terrae]|uniref:Aminoglycoside/hydroxyurea antibiotic resistance kinase n=1 Tax=Actinokineospora terrae TaxID=155974 RepID=A0A1H9XT81_9PSEU|nr:aminoglycoside phosphotransferase family protein [Actinokineospora terrae]SES49336.1 Aminoglycoside/hydroxyurea antibiotic resistance kinase [Actinokineospora terrae]
MPMLAPRLPLGTVKRLTEHYGSSVEEWLGDVENVVLRVAERNGLRVVGYHDAGWTSVIAVGVTQSAQSVVIKALPDRNRFMREVAALRHWHGRGVCALMGVDEPDQVLITELVGGRPGGGPRPTDHVERVAASLSCLHQDEVPPSPDLPELVSYYQETVIPRIERRSRIFAKVVGPRLVATALDHARTLCVDRGHRALLHSDLYAENVAFDHKGRPVFIDPHAIIGSPAYDWAFWAVYYQFDTGFQQRLDLCFAQAADLAEEAIQWMVTLAVDGALYYLENEEPQVDSMLRVLQALDQRSARRRSG